MLGKIVYLDQNKWIDLARIFHRRDTTAKSVRLLEACRVAVQAEGAVFPLSAIHYMECARVGDIERRARLGHAMYVMSGGVTIASYRAIVEHELEVSLARYLGGIQVSPFKLLSRGIAHAFGMDAPPYNLSRMVGAWAPSESRVVPPQAIAEMIEESLLAGKGPGDLHAPTFGRTSHGLAFQENLLKLDRIKELPRNKWNDALYAISLADIIEPLNAVFDRHNRQFSAFGDLGIKVMRQFVESLPSRRVDVHLLRQILKNTALKPRVTDLEDWAGLGPAVAYCDIVVCEKHFANLVQREKFQVKAMILTDVHDLAGLL